MDNQDQHIQVRIRNIFDPNPEEEYIRSVLEPDGWEVVKGEGRAAVCPSAGRVADLTPDH